MRRGDRIASAVVVAFAANAVALVVCAILFDRFSVSMTSFPVVLLVVAILSLLVPPVVTSVVKEYAPALTVGVSLISVWLVLLLADLLLDGLVIEGVLTWVVSVLVFWGAGLMTAAVLNPRPSGRRA